MDDLEQVLKSGIEIDVRRNQIESSVKNISRIKNKHDIGRWKDSTPDFSLENLKSSLLKLANFLDKYPESETIREIYDSSIRYIKEFLPSEYIKELKDSLPFSIDE